MSVASVPTEPQVDDGDAMAEVAAVTDSGVGLPAGWSDIRADPDIQFTPIDRKELEPREPSSFEKWLDSVFEWLAELFAPIGRALGSGWPVIQYVLLAIFAALAIYALVRLIGPIVRARANETGGGREVEPEWRPDQQESLALLGDADALAAEGRYGEAARLLLQRSVSQIKSARPDWVEPSSTARELAALPALSEAARRAFGTISEAVERSLFALQSLDAADWERARTAYADFALTRIGA
jgi:hypothetical protein